MLEEGGLDGLEVVAFGETLDGGDLGSVDHDGESEAGVDAAAVDEDRACSALAMVAAFLTAGEVQVLSQSVEQGCAGVEGEGVRGAVHLEGKARGLRGSRLRAAPVLRGGEARKPGGYGGAENACRLQKYDERARCRSLSPDVRGMRLRWDLRCRCRWGSSCSNLNTVVDARRKIVRANTCRRIN